MASELVASELVVLELVASELVAVDSLLMGVSWIGSEMPKREAY